MGIVAAAALLCAAVPAGPALADAEGSLAYTVVAEYPHDTDAFTEGLTIDADGQLLESVGRYGHSALILRDLHSGAVLKHHELKLNEFGEGTAIIGAHIVQLTWQNEIGYVYDHDLQQQRFFPLAHDGWGLTYDGRRLIQSDGSANLYFIDPERLVETGHVTVRDHGLALSQLNELEYVGGKIYANIWHSDRIVVIAPKSGEVIAWLDLNALHERFDLPRDWDPSDDVLNGIAYDPRSGHFFVTGKCWPKLFEIAVAPVKAR